MFESYHPFHDRHRKVLARYAVDKEAAVAALQPKRDLFYDTLSKRVHAVLEQEGVRKDRKANRARVAWYLFVFAGMITTYALFLRGTPVLWLLFPLFSWLMGGLGHDGSHFAVSTDPFVNRVACTLGMWFIASPQMWYHQHTYAHHSHTNEHEVDPDLHHFDSLRTHEEMPHVPVHEKQRSTRFVWPLFALTTFGDALFMPIKAVFRRDISGITRILKWGESSLGGPTFARATLLHVTLSIFMIVVAPIANLGFAAGMLSALGHFVVTGFLFGFFSQINHLNDHALAGSSLLDENGNEKSWATRQAESSTNWANESWIWTHFSNHLNYQIEHHLFPGVNHGYLHLIAPTVRATCKEFGVKYQAHGSFFDAVHETAKFYARLSYADSFARITSGHAH